MPTILQMFDSERGRTDQLHQAWRFIKIMLLADGPMLSGGRWPTGRAGS